MKTVCIATSTRADWGILKPLAAALRDCGLIRLQVLATNMHLLEAYGHTPSMKSSPTDSPSMPAWKCPTQTAPATPRAPSQWDCA